MWESADGDVSEDESVNEGMDEAEREGADWCGMKKDEEQMLIKTPA